MRSRRAALKRNKMMKLKKSKLDFLDFHTRSSSREPLPEYVKQRIELIKKEIIKRHPKVEEIYLIGSYANGQFIDEFTDDEYKEIRMLHKFREGLSDFDFETYPIIIDRFEVKGFKVELGAHLSGNKTKI